MTVEKKGKYVEPKFTKVAVSAKRHKKLWMEAKRSGESIEKVAEKMFKNQQS